MAQYANQGDSRFVFVNAHPPSYSDAQSSHPEAIVVPIVKTFQKSPQHTKIHAQNPPEFYI